MDYMARNVEMRLDPRLLMPEVRSIVCVALSYAPQRRIEEGEYQIATYAYGKDYHDIVKEKLHLLARACGLEGYRAFADTAPIMERYWAEKAGLGWTGRHHQLIIPGAGTMFYLGEIFSPIPIEPDMPMASRCVQCGRCIEACPTGALDKEGCFRAELCLSYQTIENRGPLSSEAISGMGDYIYGCDRCQAACPWNRGVPPTNEPSLQPSPMLLSMKKDDWHNLTIEQYRALFKGSAVKRAKYEGLMRNIKGHHK